MDIVDVFEAIWREIPQREEARVVVWMVDKLDGDKFIFDTIKDVREWALNNTDLVEPSEE